MMRTCRHPESGVVMIDRRVGGDHRRISVREWIGHGKGKVGAVVNVRTTPRGAVGG